MTSPQEQHLDVGAYVLGLLDDADAYRFEMHMTECGRCTAEFDSLAGLAPLLAEFAAATPDPRILREPPADDLLDRLLGEVSQTRARARRKRFYLVAAAAVLIIGGPIVTARITSGSNGTAVVAHDHVGPAEAAFHVIPDADKRSATDPVTQVKATVGVEKKVWGSHIVLQLGNVKGPLRCDLVAVGKNGEQQTVTTWAVPAWGYGIPDSTNPTARSPLYMHGGAAMQPDQIDHYEVRTLDGKHLVTVNA